MHEWEGFQCERFRFILKAKSLLVLPSYKGAVFRGAFGNALRRVVCAMPRGDCAACFLRENCLYVKVFEPKPHPGFLASAKFSTAHQTLVIRPPLSNGG